MHESADERPRVEMPFVEENDVDRQVRDDGVADVAADFEPLCVRWPALVVAELRMLHPCVEHVG